MSDASAPESVEHSGKSVSRRALVKTAAWAVPVIALAAPTPAMAASPIPPNGLEGWVQLQLTDTGGSNAVYSIRGENDYPDFYLRVTQTLTTQDVNSVWIVFLINRPGLTWTRGPDDENTWSLPIAGGSEILSTPSGNQTFYAYTITYTGNPGIGVAAPPFDAAAGFTTIDNRMHFITPDNVPDDQTIYTYARRYVLMGGAPLPVPNPVWFQRGPVGL